MKPCISNGLRHIVHWLFYVLKEGGVGGGVMSRISHQSPLLVRMKNTHCEDQTRPGGHGGGAGVSSFLNVAFLFPSVQYAAEDVALC